MKYDLLMTQVGYAHLCFYIVFKRFEYNIQNVSLTMKYLAYLLKEMLVLIGQIS